MNPKLINKPNHISLLLITTSLIIRIVLLRILEFHYNPLPDWCILVIEGGIYILVISLLIVESKRLAVSNINTLSIILIVMFGSILRSYITGNGYKWFEVIIFIGSSFGYFLLVRKEFTFNIRKTDLSWILVGAMVGICLPILLTIPRILVSTHFKLIAQPQIWSLLFLFLYNFFYNFAHASILEEPIFRGFLWGYLRQWGWNEKWIWLFQTTLFWLAHTNTFERPYSFWFSIPIGGLVFGLLAWRSRSIAPGMVAHALYNSIMSSIIFGFYQG